MDRRAALRARMVELRASDPEDHDGFLRTVDQLLAVSNEIIDRLNGTAASNDTAASNSSAAANTGEAEPSGGDAGRDGSVGPGVVEGRAQERATGGAEDDAR